METNHEPQENNLALVKKKAKKNNPPEAPLKNNRFYLRKYDEHPDKEFTAIVDKNGNPAACPMQPPILVPGQLTGQIELRNKPCTSDCLFFVIKYHFFDTVHHCCTGAVIKYDKYQEKKPLYL